MGLIGSNPTRREAESVVPSGARPCCRSSDPSILSTPMHEFHSSPPSSPSTLLLLRISTLKEVLIQDGYKDEEGADGRIHRERGRSRIHTLEGRAPYTKRWQRVSGAISVSPSYIPFPTSTRIEKWRNISRGFFL